MNCYKCKKIIDRMHNDCINNDELQSVKKHIEQCESCEKYYIVMDQMLNDLNTIEEKELPKGFHNRLHFALERETAKPAETKKSFTTGMKFAAIGAFSILLIIAAVTILPDRHMYDAMPNMAMEETAEEPEMMMEYGVMEKAADEELTLLATEAPMEDNAREATQESFVEEECGSADSQQVDGYPTSCSPIPEGYTVFLVLDVEDIDLTYESLLMYFDNLLPDSSWALSDVTEPEEYRQLRMLTDGANARLIGQEISMEYSEYVEKHYITLIEFDNYNQETADLQNSGYVYIVLK